MYATEKNVTKASGTLFIDRFPFENGGNIQWPMLLNDTIHWAWNTVIHVIQISVESWSIQFQLFPFLLAMESKLQGGHTTQRQKRERLKRWDSTSKKKKMTILIIRWILLWSMILINWLKSQGLIDSTHVSRSSQTSKMQNMLNYVPQGPYHEGKSWINIT